MAKTRLTATRKTQEDLRSYRWFGAQDLRAFGHRSRAMQMGYDAKDWAGKPVIAIINTWPDINPCHAHFKQRVEEVKRGVLQAGGFPLELPAMSLSEPYVKQTTMLYRNFLAMECEELIWSHPIDGAVLMGGCDKTTPALLMGATSTGLPTIFVPAGPMLRGHWQGQVLGSGSDTWKYWDELRAGKITNVDWTEIEAGIARSYGHCMTVGTASTMTGAAEALGITLPGASSIPASDANHPRMATQSGRRIVEMVWEDLTIDRVQTKGAFENAIAAVMALGGSTNGVIHLIAMGRRAGHDIGLYDFDRIGRKVPVVANIRPSGSTYLMEDFYYAGGLRGNLAPDGAVMKPAACDPRLLKHRGPALVFDSYPEMKEAVERDDLEVTADSALVLRNAGPKGGPGMPEWGMLPIPKKLVQQGVRDMLRLSDARMSGTSYGACVLHIAPESFVGGPLALIRTGDVINIDVATRQIGVELSASELRARRQNWKSPALRYERGFGQMFSQHVTQADKGCDFDCLEAHHGRPVDEPAIY